MDTEKYIQLLEESLHNYSQQEVFDMRSTDPRSANMKVIKFFENIGVDFSNHANFIKCCINHLDIDSEPLFYLLDNYPQDDVDFLNLCRFPQCSAKKMSVCKYFIEKNVISEKIILQTANCIDYDLVKKVLFKAKETGIVTTQIAYNITMNIINNLIYYFDWEDYYYNETDVINYYNTLPMVQELSVLEIDVDLDLVAKMIIINELNLKNNREKYHWCHISVIIFKKILNLNDIQTIDLFFLIFNEIKENINDTTLYLRECGFCYDRAIDIRLTNETIFKKIMEKKLIIPLFVYMHSNYPSISIDELLDEIKSQ